MKLQLTRDTVGQARIDVCRNVKFRGSRYFDVDMLMLCEKIQDAETIFDLQSAPEAVLIPVTALHADMLLSVTLAVTESDFI